MELARGLRRQIDPEMANPCTVVPGSGVLECLFLKIVPEELRGAGLLENAHRALDLDNTAWMHGHRGRAVVNGAREALRAFTVA